MRTLSKIMVVGTLITLVAFITIPNLATAQEETEDQGTPSMQEQMQQMRGQMMMQMNQCMDQQMQGQMGDQDMPMGSMGGMDADTQQQMRGMMINNMRSCMDQMGSAEMGGMIMGDQNTQDNDSSENEQN